MVVKESTGVPLRMSGGPWGGGERRRASNTLAMERLKGEG